MLSCHKDTIDLLDKIKPGFSSDFSNSSGSVICTREYNPTTVLYDVAIDMQVIIQAYTDVQKILIVKNLYNSENELVSSGSAFESDLIDTLEFSIASVDDLMNGFDFEPGNINSGYYFTFESFAILSTNDTLKTATVFQLVPAYINFCELPEIPVGNYEAQNRITGFKKNVELRKGVYIYGWIWNEVQGAWELGWTFHPEYYLLTDFALDWGFWNDWWYGTVFTIDCPKPGDTRNVIKLPGDGYDTTEELLMTDRETGANAAKILRVMPYIYQDITPDVGYYDPSNNTLVFKNVAIDDNWWHLDKHVIDDVVFTYKP